MPFNSKEWYQANKKKVSDSSREYYKKNRIKIIARVLAWKKTHKQVQYGTSHVWAARLIKLKERSRNRGWPFLITKDEFLRWIACVEQKCTYCDLVEIRLDIDFELRGISTFTIDRKNNSLPYTIENMCLACSTCNRLKAEFFSCGEFREIAQKYIKPKWEAKLGLVKPA